jgi:hypothetical protein
MVPRLEMKGYKKNGIRDSAFVFLFVHTKWNKFDLEELFYECHREEKIKLYDELYRRSEILK